MQLEAKYLFFPDLMSITEQKEMPLPNFPSPLSLSLSVSLLLVLQRSALHCLYAQVHFLALSFTFIFSHCCGVRRWTSAAPLAARAPRSEERSQETVWPPSVNYVFTARPGSRWACSTHYVSPAVDDKGSDVGADSFAVPPNPT